MCMSFTRTHIQIQKAFQIYRHFKIFETVNSMIIHPNLFLCLDNNLTISLLFHCGLNLIVIFFKFQIFNDNLDTTSEQL